MQWRYYLIIPTFLAFSILGCLPEEKAVVPSSARSFFDGAKKAENLGGAIRISWDLPSEPVKEFHVYLITDMGVETLLATVGPDKTSYTHVSNLSATKVYSYRVKAVDTSGSEDGNTKVVRSFIYKGLTSVTVTGRTTATIAIPGELGAFDKIRIYGTPSGGARKLFYEADPGVYFVNITGLRSGTSYSFTAQAYNSSLQTEDGNALALTAKTLSYSFDGSDYRYRGVLSVVAYGNAPGAPLDPLDLTRIPATRKVQLTFLPFVGGNYSTRYKIVRVNTGDPIDMTVTALCTNATTTSCVVCDMTGQQICNDLNVAAPPQKYDYAISEFFNDGSESYIEELPSVDGPFRVTVAIPPDNMVLINRDAANFEMCSLLGRSSDPQNHQRCIYSGYGARPKNSGPGKPDLNLPDYYYDFGYNLFIDRWETACNFTKASEGGKCGPGGTAGDCWGATYAYDADLTKRQPSDTIGVDGNVFYEFSSYTGAATAPYSDFPRCFIKDAGAWKQINSSRTSAQLAAATTNNPALQGGHRPPIQKLEQSDAAAICSAQSDPSYGSKRLLRMREFRAAAAWPLYNGEPNALPSLSLMSRYEDPANKNANNELYCNTRSFRITLPGDANLYVNSPSEILSTSGYEMTRYKISSTESRGAATFIIGSHSTSMCLSRYGAQDLIGNVPENVSDQIDCDANGDCLGVDSSSYDSGNWDLKGIPFNGLTVWGFHSFSGALAYSDGYFAATFTPDGSGRTFSYISAPLGLPLMVNNNGEATARANFRFYDTNDVYEWNSNLKSRRASFLLGGHHDYGGNSGRWGYVYDSGFGSKSTRCAVSAE